MNDKTGGTRGLRSAAALAVVTAVAVLSTACGVVHVHFGSSAGSGSTVSAPYPAELAYAQCMRAHGLPNFPIPHPSERFRISEQINGNSPAARANDACRHLLRGGSTATASPPGAVSADCLASRPPCYTPRQQPLTARQSTLADDHVPVGRPPDRVDQCPRSGRRRPVPGIWAVRPVTMDSWWSPVGCP